MEESALPANMSEFTHIYFHVPCYSNSMNIQKVPALLLTSIISWAPFMGQALSEVLFMNYLFIL